MSIISVIIPVYNVEKYLSVCIDSILNQTFNNLEIILIDDGSTDGSGRICDLYQLKDTRINTFHIKNHGQSFARNFGINIAKGDYLGFVDSDDWISPHMYECLYDNLIKNESEISVCNFYKEDYENSFSVYTANAKNKIFTRQEAMKEIIDNRILTFSPCNKLYKRNLFQNIKFHNDRIFEDMDISYKLINNSNKIVYTSDPLYYYRYNPKSTLQKGFTKKRLDQYFVRKEMYYFYKNEYPKIAKFVFGYMVVEGIQLYKQLIIAKEEKIENYKYLITHKKVFAIYSILINYNIENRKKLFAIPFLLFPSTIVKFYRLAKSR